MEAVVDGKNPFFTRGTVLRGHEFHYGRLVPDGRELSLSLDVRRGAGSQHGRDGLVAGNVFATWIHLHALGTVDWAPALVDLARNAARDRKMCGSATT